MAGAESLSTASALAVPETLNSAGIARLRADLAAANRDEATRVIVLRGGKETFCRGMDLAEISEGVGDDADAPWRGATAEFGDLLRELAAQPCITVAVVEGAALGGGVGLAAACDFVVSTEAASFALPELLLGIVPAAILPFLAERIGLARAKRWALSQQSWPPAEANAAGLVDRVVKALELEIELRRLLRGLRRNHPRGVRSLKQLVREIGGASPASAVGAGVELLGALLARPDVRRDLAQFHEFGLLPSQGEE